MFCDKMAEARNHTYVDKSGNLHTLDTVTGEYGAKVRLQLAKETGENPVLVVLNSP